MPYSLRIEDYLGAVDTRNAHQWRRVKYSYMDARRLANDRGMIVRGPQKLFDSSIAHMGMLFATSCGDDVVERYHDIIFEGFFKRELNIEILDHVLDALSKAGASSQDFQEFLTGPGPALRHLCSPTRFFGAVNAWRSCAAAWNKPLKRRR